MYSYGLLEPGCYYLVQEKVESPIELIKATVESDHCMYIIKYQDELLTAWKRKNDPLFDIVECLSDEMVEAWEKHYNNNEESYYEEDEDWSFMKHLSGYTWKFQFNSGIYLTIWFHSSPIQLA